MSSTPFARLPLSRYEVDRDHLTRDRPDLFDELWADPATRVVVVAGGEALLASASALALLPPAALGDVEERIYLGRTTTEAADAPAGTPIVAAMVADAGALTEGEWADLRRIGADLSDRDAGLLTEALAMAHWHASHRFSPVTGEPTTAGRGGWVRIDPVNGKEIFPRTDPAIIVGVTDADDRLLLGSNALWESNRYSLLAGFVEPGESLEAAVLREVFEESGIRVADPVYLGSQPWPFPASLMLGFRARLDTEFENVLTPDGAEILDLRWFAREELGSSLDEVRLPGRTSIARAIIEDWYGGPLGEDRW